MNCQELAKDAPQFQTNLAVIPRGEAAPPRSSHSTQELSLAAKTVRRLQRRSQSTGETAGP